jgi:small neutral amino acid transporter SnatA (MarC family)
MGLILAAVAVQFIINGIADVLPQMLAGVRGQRA